MSKYPHLLGFMCLVGAFGAMACGSDPDPGGASAAATDGFEPVPPGATRQSFTLDDFELAAGSEVYRCQNFQNPFGKDIAIVQSQSTMSHGSHHLAVFRIDQNADGALEECSGLEFHGTLHAAQTPVARTTYPDGVGAFHVAEDGIRLNVHYLNLSTQPIHPKIEVALDYVDGDAVTYKAAQIYLNDSTLDIPPGHGTAGGTLAVPPEAGNIRIISAQSHMHRRAVGFTSSLEDGTELYDTESWNEPPVKVYSPEVQVNAGTRISWKCDYDNDTTRHLTFGESANVNEMCVLTGFYYPAPSGMTLVGDMITGTMGLTR